MPEDFKTYTTVAEQSVYDICLNTYGSLNLLSKLFYDNGISSVSKKLPAGSKIRYDARLVSDQRFAEQGYTFATKASVPGSLLLDLYPGATIACSTRRLSSTYNGMALRLRRSSDSKEQDIGFTDDNDLDRLKMLEFLGSDTGYVTTWYDQSGKGQHFVQPDKNKQPVMVEMSLKRYGLRSDGTDDFMYSTLTTAIQQDYTYAMITKIVGGSGERFIFNGRASNSNSPLNIRAGGSARIVSHGYLYTYTWPLNTYEVLLLTRSTLDGALRRNMVNTPPTTMLANTLDLKFLRLFAEASANLSTVLNYGECIMPEVVVWNRDNSAEAQNINNNLNNYFKIY